MMTLAYPWAWALLPLPLLVAWLAPVHRETRRGLVVPFLDRLAEQTGRAPASGGAVLRGGWLRGVFLAAGWLCLVAALARPQWIEPPVTKSVPVRDLLLAVDLSGSMETADFTDAQGRKIDRLTAIKAVLDDFLSHQQGARVGLIFFGTAPFVQAPFTEDLQVCRELLGEAQVGMAGPQTALGDAIGLAITLFDRSPVKERVLIVLTDGNDTSSRVPPVDAARIAKDKGIVIHAVGVGDPRAAGEEALDEDTLKEVAATTGGVYSFAADRGQLADVYRQLDRMQAHQEQVVQKHPRRDVYYWPLAFGLIASLLQQALAPVLSKKVAIRPPAPSPNPEPIAA